jgi:hypothetical protein
MVEKLWDFEDFNPSSGMLSAIVIARKSIQNLPKNETLKYHQKSRLQYFSKIKRRKTLGPEGPGVNEVSFCARPHHNVHRTLGVDAGTTGPH